jgi:hypothetical protein
MMIKPEHSQEAFSRFIGLHDRPAIDQWCRALNCNERELRIAIHTVGNMAPAVRDYFRNKKGRHS